MLQSEIAHSHLHKHRNVASRAYGQRRKRNRKAKYIHCVYSLFFCIQILFKLLQIYD